MEECELLLLDSWATLPYLCPLVNVEIKCFTLLFCQWRPRYTSIELLGQYKSSNFFLFSLFRKLSKLILTDSMAETSIIIPNVAKLSASGTHRRSRSTLPPSSTPVMDVRLVRSSSWPFPLQQLLASCQWNVLNQVSRAFLTSNSRCTILTLHRTVMEESTILTGEDNGLVANEHLDLAWCVRACMNFGMNNSCIELCNI